MTGKVRCFNTEQRIEFNDSYYADVIAGWGDELHHLVVVGGGDIGELEPAPQPTPSGIPRVVRCQHHVQGQPCGALIEGRIPNILEHFSRVHVRPRTVAQSGHPSEFWTCRWGGTCDSHMRKLNFRRHVVGHLFRWKCSTCSSTYSRDYTARNHTIQCGDGSGRISMEPRLEVRPRQM